MKALRVWKPDPILRDTVTRASLLDFSAARGIGVLWMEAEVRGMALDDQDGWGRLLTEAHHRGIRIHAADRSPLLARRQNRLTVINFITAIGMFNRWAPHDGRFDGVHLDIQPQRLPEWDNTAARRRLLDEYLELISHVREMVGEAGALEYGVSIPSPWPGRRLLDMVDYVEVDAAQSGEVLRHAAAARVRVFVDVDDYLTPAGGPARRPF